MRLLISRRVFSPLVAAALMWGGVATSAHAEEAASPSVVKAAETVPVMTATHGLSVFGALKYPAGFKHFDYVNPAAPKGGRISMIGPAGRTTFDSFNGFILKGDAAQGLDTLFDSLMVRAADEPDSVYGLVAQSAVPDPDGKGITFKLRPEAKFADGSPVTAEDVVFSFTTLKEKGHPQYSLSLRDVATCEAPEAGTVRYTFKGDQTRDLPITVATLPILSKAFYTAHPFEQTTLEPPLGSGPYKIDTFKAGTFVNFKRRDDYWARDLPVNVGRFNFDELRYEYYRDRTARAAEYACRAPMIFARNSRPRTGRCPMTCRRSAMDASSASPSRTRTLPVRRVSSSIRGGAKFADPRVRQALDLAFDFEWTNKNLFFGLYKRTVSFFENSDLKATGLPSPSELALLEPFRDKLPVEVFAEPYSPPVTDGSGQDRPKLHKASDLLTQAGWDVKGAKRVNAQGETLDVEFLIFEPTFERVIGPYVKNLQAIGVQAVIRRVDAAQYERRVKSFDFDVTVQRYVMRLTPGVELKNFWGSEAARTDGSYNLAGISDPVVDALIAKVMAAKSREEMTTAARAIDRVLRAGHYWVPHWYKAVHNLAFWNKFSWPAVKPKYDRGAPDTWWYDTEKAAKLKPN